MPPGMWRRWVLVAAVDLVTPRAHALSAAVFPSRVPHAGGEGQVTGHAPKRAEATGDDTNKQVTGASSKEAKASGAGMSNKVEQDFVTFGHTHVKELSNRAKSFIGKSLLAIEEGIDDDKDLPTKEAKSSFIERRLRDKLTGEGQRLVKLRGERQSLGEKELLLDNTLHLKGSRRRAPAPPPPTPPPTPVQQLGVTLDDNGGSDKETTMTNWKADVIEMRKETPGSNWPKWPGPNSLNTAANKEKYWKGVGDGGKNYHAYFKQGKGKQRADPAPISGSDKEGPSSFRDKGKLGDFGTTINKPRWVLYNVIEPAVKAIHEYEGEKIDKDVAATKALAETRVNEEIPGKLSTMRASTTTFKDSYAQDVKNVNTASANLDSSVQLLDGDFDGLKALAYSTGADRVAKGTKYLNETMNIYDRADANVMRDVNTPALKDYVFEGVDDATMALINSDNTEGLLESAASDLSAVSQEHMGTVDAVLASLTSFDSLLENVGSTVQNGADAVSNYETEGQDTISGVQNAADEGIGTLQDAESELIGQTTSGIGGMTGSLDSVWEGIESLENSASEEVEVVEQNTENAMETTEEDAASIEEVVKDKLLFVDNSLRELEKEVEKVADQGYDLSEAQADLDDEGEESLEALNDTAKALVAQIKQQGDEKRESDEQNVTKKLDSAVNRADKWLTREVEMFVANTSKTMLYVDRELKKGGSDVDKYASRVETAVRMMEPRREALIAGVAGAKKELRRTKASSLRRWEKYKGLEETRKDDFRYAVEAKEAHFLRDLGSLDPMLETALQSYDKVLQDAERDAGNRVQDARDAAQAELEEMVDRLREEVEANQIKYTPEELKAKAEKVQAKIRAFPPVVQQEALAVTTAWNRNENKIDDLDAFGDRNQDILMNSVRKELNKALNHTAQRMERVRLAQNERFMEANATERHKFASLRRELLKVEGLMTQTGDDFRTNLSMAFTKLDDIYNDLQANGQALNSKLVTHDNNMAVRTASARESYRDILNELVEFRRVVEASLHEGVQEMLLSSQNLGTSISDVGNFLEPRVKELVTAYIEGGAEKAREVYDRNRKREKDVEPSGLKRLLDELENRTAAEDDDAKRVSDGIVDMQRVYADGSRQTADDADGYIRDAELQSLNGAQKVISDAIESGKRSVNDEVVLTEEEIQAQAKELQNYSSDLDGALATFDLVGSSEVDNETHDVLKLQADVNNQRRINEKYGAKVAAAVRDLQEMGKHDEAKFLGAMGRVGQILALGLEGGKAEFDSQVVGMKSFFTNDVEQKMKDLKSTFGQYIERLGDEFTPLQNALNGLLTQEQTTMSEYEANVASQERWMENELLPAAAVQQDAIQAALRSNALKVSQRMMEMKAGGRHGSEVLQQETDEVFNKLREGIHELLVMKNYTVDTIDYMHKKMQMDSAELSNNVAHLLDLEKYQEESAMVQLKKDIGSAAAQAQRLKNWRSLIEPDQAQWQTIVAKEFSDMGYALDISDAELKEAQNDQQWAVEEAMNHLSQELKGEMGQMSEATLAQLGQLAQAAGQQIAALMADDSLTDAQRAEKIAKIKKDMAMRAREVLSQNQRLELSQAAQERQVRVATEDLQSTIMRIASLEQPASNPSFDRSHLDTQLDKQIGTLRTEIDVQPTYNGKGSDPTAAPGAGGSLSLLEVRERVEASREARSFVQRFRAMHEDAAAVAEDTAWAQWLAQRKAGREPNAVQHSAAV